MSANIPSEKQNPSKEPEILEDKNEKKHVPTMGYFLKGKPYTDLLP